MTHSFPTRRSSDLKVDLLAELGGGRVSRTGRGGDLMVSDCDGDAAVLEHLARFAVPEAWEVYEMLEAVASFRPERQADDQSVMPSEEQFLAALELVRQGKEMPALRDRKSGV